MQGQPSQQDPPHIRGQMPASSESPNLVGMPTNAMDGVYTDMKKQIEVGETSINNMMNAIANKDANLAPMASI